MQKMEGATIDVVVYASALQSFDPAPVGPVGLLKMHRPLLERIASEKYDRDAAAANNLLHITDDDLRAAKGNEGTANETE